jgi:hypothetical protein
LLPFDTLLTFIKGNGMKKLLISTLMVLLIPSFLFAQSKGQTKIQLSILLDTSSSMDGLIDQAKSQLWAIINELARAQKNQKDAILELSLYEYGNDRLSMKDGYIRNVVPFTTDVDLISEKLFELTTNGGSEHCPQVVVRSLDEMKWSTSNDDLRLIIIAGNEEFQQGPITTAVACKRAKEMDVYVNTIFCGNFNQGKNIGWDNLSTCTNAAYNNIDMDKKFEAIATPYDDELATLNGSINKTYVWYGEEGKVQEARQMKQDDNSSKYGSANLAERAATKSNATLYNYSRADLVDAIKNDPTVLDKLKKEELPKELQGKSKEQITKELEKSSAERTAMQKKIAELSTQRKKFIDEKRKDLVAESSLEQALNKAIKKQATKSGFVFKN